MKNTFTAITLATVLTFGATLANAGIIIGDKAAPAPCKEVSTYGILVSDSPMLSGVLTAIAGIIIGDKPAPSTCVEKNGILVSD